MYLLNNKPFINLEPYVDITALEKQLPYLNYAVVRTTALSTPSKYYGNSFLQEGLTGLLDVVPTVDLTQYEFLQELKELDLLGAWVRYQSNISYGQQSQSIYYSLDYSKKHLESHRVGTWAVPYFKPFFDWLHESNIFSEYGRAVVFPNEPNTMTPIHCDYPDAISRKDEFIWINLDGRKKFFMYDPSTNEKTYVDGKVSTFDNSSYHGCDPVEWATWSIRVDGVFSDEFLDKTNLRNHYRG